jgi:hypothetical protein
MTLNKSSLQRINHYIIYYAVFLVVAVLSYSIPEVLNSFLGGGEQLPPSLAWVKGPTSQKLFLLTLLTATLLLAIAILQAIVRPLFHPKYSRQKETAPAGKTLSRIDFIFAHLEPFLPARTMNEVAGDVRERIALLYDQGAPRWKVRAHIAQGVLFILLDASREALAFRRKKKG